MGKKVKGGILLIVVGVFLLLNQLGLIMGQTFLLLLALGFIGAYFLLGGRKEYGNVGFLIPGVILLAIAGFASISDRIDDFSPIFFFLGLSLSFFIVFIIHTYWFKNLDSGDRFWPVYPAGGLLLLAGIIALGLSGRFAESLGLLNYIWIIALIVIGAWLVYSSLKKNRGKEK
jgi:hypothetical protein